MTQKSASDKTIRERANERPLVEDIRMLGRILGHVIRDQDGAAAFELIERIRKLSVAFRRDADHEADRLLKQLLAARDTIKLQARDAQARKDTLMPRELAHNEDLIQARVMQLWQTRLLRCTKLTVADEIEHALSYYDATFLRELPKLYANLERGLGQSAGASAA